MRKIILGTVLVLSLSFLTGASSFAQMPAQQMPTQQMPRMAPDTFSREPSPLDINNVPVLSNIVKAGAKLYYLGVRSGLYGWFIVKDGQIQMIYVTSDGKTAIIGGMFTADGDNVTGEQINTLAENNKEVSDLIGNAGKQQEDVNKAGSIPGGFAAVPGNPSPSGNANNKPFTVANVQAVSLSPGERLLQDLNAAAGVTLGNNPNAQITMVIDPNCPHCQATWKELRDSVFKNKAQVRLVPISNIGGGDDARAAARLLMVANPLDAWDKYVNGDQSGLAGDPDSTRMQAILANRSLIDKWNIRATPYIVYHAKDGRVKIVQGEPDRMAAVLADLLK